MASTRSSRGSSAHPVECAKWKDGGREGCCESDDCGYEAVQHARVHWGIGVCMYISQCRALWSLYVCEEGRANRGEPWRGYSQYSQSQRDQTQHSHSTVTAQSHMHTRTRPHVQSTIAWGGGQHATTVITDHKTDRVLHLIGLLAAGPKSREVGKDRGLRTSIRSPSQET